MATKSGSTKSSQTTKNRRRVSYKERIQQKVKTTKTRLSNYLARRPHRSLRRSRRRDYVRSLQLPGYWSFTISVFKLGWQNRGLFFWVILVYAGLTAALVGLASQDTYSVLSDTLRETGGEVFDGEWSEVGQASLLLLSGVMGTFSTAPTEVQQVYAALIGLLTWLTTVWLARAVIAGKKPRFRDGLYNASSPLVSTALVALVGVIQLLPAAIAVIAISAALGSGFIDGGAVSMIFVVAAALFVVASVYWITSTFIALVVVTLPGMYPLQAIRTAGDLVIGRRLRILYRWAWLLLVLLVVWAVIMIPIILFDAWIKGVIPAISWVPAVPVALLIVSSFTVFFAALYVYMFYRKVVDDDSAPA